MKKLQRCPWFCPAPFIYVQLFNLPQIFKSTLQIKFSEWCLPMGYIGEKTNSALSSLGYRQDAGGSDGGVSVRGINPVVCFALGARGGAVWWQYSSQNLSILSPKQTCDSEARHFYFTSFLSICPKTLKACRRLTNTSQEKKFQFGVRHL